MKDPELARKLAVRRANTEGQRMIVWHNPADLGFGRFVIRPSDGVAPRTFDARGKRIQWSIWTVAEPAGGHVTPAGTSP